MKRVIAIESLQLPGSVLGQTIIQAVKDCCSPEIDPDQLYDKVAISSTEWPGEKDAVLVSNEAIHESIRGFAKRVEARIRETTG